MAAAATTDPRPSGPVGSLDLLPSIDMASLSQSELRALALCSSSSFAASRTAIPAIDRSIFNESAGSRRQTFSRPSPHHHHHRHRLTGILPKASAAAAAPPPAPEYTNDPANDPDRPENLSIIGFLKQFLATHPDFQQEEFDLFSHFNNSVQIAPVASPQKKRKRGRKPGKMKLMVVNTEQQQQRPEEKKFAEKLEVVNKHGAVVDLVQLAGLEDPFREELRRRTVGMTKEDELLGFLRDLEGEWCSRRRKRKFVDAGVLGDALPVGWKLLLALKRKEGRAWVYCRRYVSPGGQHFLSCKEVSEYMQSVLGSHSAPQGKEIVIHDQLDHRVLSLTNDHVIREVNDGWQSDKRDKELPVPGMDNLAEVNIHDHFQCRKCNMTFGERDLYLNHLLSSHQKTTTRKFRLGSSVGDGVIVKDGKYECQFCHKVFHERRRYNGHVGVHVRNYVRGVEESPAERMALQKQIDSPLEDDELPAAKISKMDALIEIAQNSILEASSSVPNHDGSQGLGSDNDNANSAPVPISVVDSHLPDVNMQDSIKEKAPEVEVQKEGVVNIIEEVENVAGGSEVSRIDSSSSSQLQPVSEFLKGKRGLAFNHEGKSEGFTTGSSVGLYGAGFSVNDEGITVNTVPHEGTGATILLPELDSDLSTESTPFAMLDKEGNEFDAGVDELRVEDMELVGLETEQEESLMATEGGPMHKVIGAEMENMCGVSGPLDSGFGSGTVQGSEELFPTMCTWCGVEFGYASSGSGAQSGSAGYMCHSCRMKVSMEVDR